MRTGSRHRKDRKDKKKFKKALLGVIVLAASCATLPQSAVGEFDLLAPGGEAYVWADVRRGGALAALVVPAPPGALERTDVAVAAVYPPGQGHSYLAAAWGRYPQAGGSLAFAAAAGWKRVKGENGPRYWRRSQDSLSVYLDSRLALVSDAEPFVPLRGQVRPPEFFAPYREGALLAGWFTGEVTPFLEALGIPLQIPAKRLVFGVYPGEAGEEEAEKSYIGKVRIETPSEREARALARAISVARLFLVPGHAIADGLLGADDASRLAAALLANAPEQEGAALVFHTGPIDAAGVRLLLQGAGLRSPAN